MRINRPFQKCEMENTYSILANLLQRLRRENPNIFDVFFTDKEIVCEEYVKDEMPYLCDFFSLDIPELTLNANTSAEVELVQHKQGVKAQLRLNIQKLESLGFNNKDALIACLCHELAHVYSAGQIYGYLVNGNWECELYADFVASFLITRLNVAGGKYRFIVGKSKATLTHPYGEIRKLCSETARNYALTADKTVNIPLTDVESHFFLFLLTHSKEINEYYVSHKNEIENIQDSYDYQIEIDNLAETNILKQYVQRWRDENDEKL